MVISKSLPQQKVFIDHNLCSRWSYDKTCICHRVRPRDMYVTKSECWREAWPKVDISTSWHMHIHCKSRSLV